MDNNFNNNRVPNLTVLEPMDAKATFRQHWAVAFYFGEQIADQFPLIDLKTLAKRLNASMLSFHHDDGSYLSRSKAQAFLDGQESCPEEYSERIIYNEEYN